jgi:polyferredoxin
MERRTITLQPKYDPKSPKRFEPEREKPGFDLMRLKWLRPLILWKHNRTVAQIILLVASVAIIYDGFFGEQFAPKNVATVGAWIDYRWLLVLSLIAFGSIFCMACPFVLVSRAVQKRIGRNWAFPTWLKGKWLATGLLLAIFWSYEVFGIWDKPLLTASITVAYFAAAVLVDSFFKGNAFCKYVCPIGLFTQAYSLVSPTEIKAKNPEFCRTDCTTKDCINGNAQTKQQGCQTFLYLGTKHSNMDCTYCLDCIKACPHDNIALQFRAPTKEFAVNLKKRDFSVAVMATVITFSALTNAAGMVKPFQELERSLSQALGLNNSIVVYSFVFVVGLVILPLLFGWLASFSTQKLTGTDESLKEIFKRFAPALIPVGFGIWVAHYFFHFVVGGTGIFPAIANLFNNLGVPVFGQPNWIVSPILPYSWIFPLQVAMIYLGFMVSCVAIYNISRKLYKKKVARRAMFAWLALTLLIGVAGILILLQPMQARGTFSL